MLLVVLLAIQTYSLTQGGISGVYKGKKKEVAKQEFYKLDEKVTSSSFKRPHIHQNALQNYLKNHARIYIFFFFLVVLYESCNIRNIVQTFLETFVLYINESQQEKIFHINK